MSMITPTSQWFTGANPGAAAQATASRSAAGAGVRHYAKRVIASISTGANAQTPLNLNLRDGTTGAGTILMSWTVACPANSAVIIDADNLHIPGTAATAMTIEFGGAGVAASVEVVNLAGYDQP